MNIPLAGWARSGNSLLRLLIWQVFGIQTFPREDEDVYRERLKDCVSAEALAPGENNGVSFSKTHSAPEDDSPFIFLVRDGRDAIVSFYHYIHTHLHIPASMRQVICEPAPIGTAEGKPLSGHWSDYFREWNPLESSRGMLVKYEDLLVYPDDIAKQIAVPFGFKPRRKFVNNFPALHASQPNGFRTGKSGGWKDELVGADLKVLWKTHGAVMRLLSYE